MKMVTMTEDVRPYHRGQDVPMPDEMADKLVASGSAKDPRPWPEGQAPAEAPRPAPQTYQTRDMRPNRQNGRRR